MVLELPKTYLRLTELPSVFDYRFRDRLRIEVGAFYWTVLAPDIVNSGRVEQDSASV